VSRKVSIYDAEMRVLTTGPFYLFNLGASASSQAGGEGGPEAHKQKKK